MKLWLMYALFATGLWGLWGFFGKMASRTITSHNLLVVASAGCIVALVLGLILYSKSLPFRWNTINYFYGFLSGFVLIIGLFFFYKALAHGEVTRVVVITATYPLVTLVLAYLFLREPLSFQKALGALLAISGIFFLSI
ncbi:MAG: EamA family transporter [Deltaproteobacteria bacterium]|nr:EamA family transporter [Deltaproteobacteria bacterium]